MPNPLRFPRPNALLISAALLVSAPAMAYTPFALDELRVQWQNLSVDIRYIDNFDNGDPLTGGIFTNVGTGASSPGSNFVTTRSGAAPVAGSEAGGRLRFAWDDMLDSTFGGVILGRSMNYFLATSTQYSAGGNLESRGLWKGNDFKVEAVYDLTTPLPGDQMRLRLWDTFTGHASNDVLDLTLARQGDGYAVRSRRLNLAPGNVDESASTGDISGLAGSADQILLSFSHEAGDAFVTTGYSFVTGGVVTGSDTVGTLSLYNGEDWTRASFSAYAVAAPVPEPQTAALLLLGLAAVGNAARRRRS